MVPTATRGVSPVIGTVLLVGLAVVLAGGVFAAGTAMDTLDGPPPAATLSGAEVTAACPGCGPHDQMLRLSHDGGDAIALANVALVVVLPDGRETRLVDLPLSTNCIGDRHVDGPDVFDGRCGRVGGAVTTVGSDSDGTWTAGETIHLRLQKGAVELSPGDVVSVRVLHAPTSHRIGTLSLPVVADAAG